MSKSVHYEQGEFFNPMTRKQRRERFARERAEVADRWFEGNEQMAGLVFEEMPYSKIPTWTDVKYLMTLLESFGFAMRGEDHG